VVPVQVRPGEAVVEEVATPGDDTAWEQQDPPNADTPSWNLGMIRDLLP